jgi:hypothetical protein
MEVEGRNAKERRWGKDREGWKAEEERKYGKEGEGKKVKEGMRRKESGGRKCIIDGGDMLGGKETDGKI